MNKKQYWILRLFFILFTVSVSFTVIPSEIINVYGLFGEVDTSAIIANKDESANMKSRYYGTVQKAKGINIINIWFALMVLVICICLLTHLMKLPRVDTIVTLKIRMDD